MICACVDFRGIFLLLVVLRDSWIGGLVASLILENSQPLLLQIFFSSVFSFCLWYSNYTWLDLLNSSHKFLMFCSFFIVILFPFPCQFGTFLLPYLQLTDSFLSCVPSSEEPTKALFISISVSVFGVKKNKKQQPNNLG